MALSTAWQDFVTAARGGEPERTPVALIVDSPWLPAWSGTPMLDFFLYPDRWLDVYLRLARRFPDVTFLAGFWVEYGMANEPSAFGAPVVWHADSPPSLRAVDLPPERWHTLPRPNPETDGLMPLVLRRMENLENGGLPEPHRLHIAAARGPLAVASHVLGATRFLEATAADPEAVEAALEIFTDLAVAWLRAQLDRMREPVGILLLDDLPGLLSPRSYQRLAEPYLQRIFDAFDGLLRIYHNDTPCPHLLPHLGRLRCEALNFSHEMDIGVVKQALGPKISLIGNVPPLGVLARGSVTDVEREARLVLEKAARGGGLILSAGGGTSPGTPEENIDALVGAARAWDAVR